MLPRTPSLCHRRKCDTRPIVFEVLIRVIETVLRGDPMRPLEPVVFEAINQCTYFEGKGVSVEPASISLASRGSETSPMRSCLIVRGFVPAKGYISFQAIDSGAAFLPSRRNFCLNQRSLTTTTTILMNPRFVIMGVMYTKICW